MKRQFVFHWLTSPGLATPEARADLAARFRAYRRNARLYVLYREGPGEYRVHIAGSNDPGAIGVFRAIEPVNLVSGKEAANV